MLKLKLKFNNQDLLKQALTHRSYLNENPGLNLKHNERLEFLGDAVLELIATEYLFQNYKNPEGELTAWRAALVNADMLAKKAKELGLGKDLLLSKGETKDTGKARNYILANALEALIGAIYLDQGYQAAKNFVQEYILIELPSILKNKLYIDSKSQFQEKAQENTGITPEYKSLKEWGPDHDKKFKIGVYLNTELVASAIGSSKQESQQKAAEKALQEKNW
ncbi:MAG: ribonuclease III [bacterium]